MAGAGEILSRLQILLDADTANFETNIKKAGDTADTSFSKIMDKASGMGTAVLAGATVAAGAITALTVETINTAKEIQNAAAAAGIGAEKLQYLAVGAQQLGIDQEKLSDILKDVNEKVGEFVATEGGGMADFFTNIAPKVGVTAEQFAKLSGPEALQLYVSSMEKANLSQQQMTYYMESFASDSSKLLPLIKNNGAGFKLFGDEALRVGGILDKETIAKTNELKAAQFLLENQVKGLKNEIVIGVLPTMVDLADAFSTTTKNGVKLVGVSDVVSFGMKGIAASALGAWAAVDLLGSKLNEATGWKSSFKNFDVQDLYKPGGIVNIFRKSAVEAASARMGDESSMTDFMKKQEAYAAKLEKIWNPDSAQSSIKALAEMYTQLNEIQTGSDTAGNLGKTAAEAAAKKLKAEADAAAKAAANAAAQLQNSYNTQAQGLERQIALYGETTAAAQMKYDLEHSELAKLQPQQKAYLQQLADQLDVIKKQADLTKLFNDRKAQLNLENDLLNIQDPIIRELYRLQKTTYEEFDPERRKELLLLDKRNLVTKEYQSLLEGIKTPEQARYDAVYQQLNNINYAMQMGIGNADQYSQLIDKAFSSENALPDVVLNPEPVDDYSKLDSARMDLESALQQRTEIMQAFRDTTWLSEQKYQEQMAELQRDYANKSIAIDQQQADIRRAAYASLFGGIAELTKAFAGEQSKVYKVMFALSKAFAIADSLVKIQQGISNALILPYPYNLFAAANVAAEGAKLMTTLKSINFNGGGSDKTTISTPSSAASTVTPVAEQQPTGTDTTQQTTTIQIPQDTLFTGRQIVDLINTAFQDGKRLDASALSFIGI